MVREIIKSLPGFKRIRNIRNSFNSADKHWGRVIMNRETRKLVEGLQPQELRVLEIAGDYWQNLLSFKEYKSVKHQDFDICASTLPETFDLIIAEQVFEHLLWPYRAGKNIHRMLNPEGHFLITTPFLVRLHAEPVDCSRWTELGMKHLLAECGFPLEKIKTGSWGNRDCVKANLDKWVRYRNNKHSLKNDTDFPYVVWALAEK